jgi:hypothetical protein
VHFGYEVHVEAAGTFPRERTACAAEPADEALVEDALPVVHQLGQELVDVGERGDDVRRGHAWRLGRERT